MTSSIIALIVVPLLDQSLKLLLSHRLQRRPIPLGALGALQATQGRIWMMWAPPRWTLGTVWLVWITAAAVLTIAGVVLPSLALFCGLLAGGSLSHAIEMSLRHSICDYICFRFWPAFDLADVAIAMGAFGIVFELLAVMPKPWA
jgi:lipoprotein signal peptidase